MLNPHWLNTFKTLIETGHFTKTAEKLYMTQPGVSQHIRKLEEACGYALINRHKKSFEVTEQGRRVYEYALLLEKNESDLLENLGVDDPYAGQCKLSCSGSLALHLYPRLLSLQSQHPDLIVQMEAAPNHRILDSLQENITDLGIVTYVPNESLFDVEEIGIEPLCLILPEKKEFQAASADSLKDLGLIRHPDANHYLSIYFSRCGNDDFNSINIDEIPTSGYINQLGQILLPVAKGLGFTVLPQSAVNSFPEAEKLKLFKPANQVYETLYLVKKRNRDLPKRFETITSEIISVLNE